MARTPVTLQGWVYNDDVLAKPMMVGTFIEAMPADHSDPASFQPRFSIEVEIPMTKAGKRTERTVNPIEPAPAPAPAPAPTPPPEDEPDPERHQSPRMQASREAVEAEVREDEALRAVEPLDDNPPIVTYGDNPTMPGES